MAAQTARLVLPTTYRASLASHSRSILYGKFQPVKAWMKGLQQTVLQNRSPGSLWKLYIHRYLDVPSFQNAGHKFSVGSIFGVSVALGSVILCTRPAYSMGGVTILEDDHRQGLLGDSKFQEDPHTLLMFASKLLVPACLFLTVFMNAGHPAILAAKVIIIFLTTKPSPFSVYMFVDQLQRQYMRQHPILSKFKSLYATKVEVEDYTILCLARVDLNNQKHFLIGALGSWWVLPLDFILEAFSALEDRAVSFIGY